MFRTYGCIRVQPYVLVSDIPVNWHHFVYTLQVSYDCSKLLSLAWRRIRRTSVIGRRYVILWIRKLLARHLNTMHWICSAIIHMCRYFVLSVLQKYIARIYCSTFETFIWWRRTNAYIRSWTEYVKDLTVLSLATKLLDMRAITALTNGNVCLLSEYFRILLLFQLQFWSTLLFFLFPDWRERIFNSELYICVCVCVCVCVFVIEVTFSTGFREGEREVERVGGKEGYIQDITWIAAGNT